MGSARASPRSGRAKARQQAALAFETCRRYGVLSRAERFIAELQSELAQAARCHAIAGVIIGELESERAILS
jgi:hypothetical protein